MAATTPQRPQRKVQKSRDGTCFGVIEEAVDTAHKRKMERKQPQPWIVRKLMVGITLGLMGYAAFVYIQYLCLPMIRRKNNSQGSRRIGIMLLTIFSVLYLWMIWAYIRVVMTSPGYARDYISKTERPLLPASVPMRESWNSTPVSHNTDTNDHILHDVEMGYRSPSPFRRTSLSPTLSRGHATAPIMRKDTVLAGPSYEDLLRRDGASTSEAQGPNTRVDAISAPAPKPAFLGDSKTVPGGPASSSPVPTSSTTVTSHHQQQYPSITNSKLKLKKPKPLSPSVTPVSTKRQQKWMERERVLQSLNVTRRPPTSAVLQPIHRYCSTDEILKPYRAHHCRVCGTCVLKYDHHCPWIGQCVGARNHKFFLNFCQATAFFCGYIFATLLAYTISGMNRTFEDDVNPQEIVVIALAALFLLFTSMLVVTHINLILKGQTTVESVQIMSMKDRENRTLAKGFDCWEISAKRRKQQEWDQEWGRLNAEGHIWWRGNLREHWTDVMGDWWLGWILPVGRSGGDGLSYPVNPRFDAEGRWRRRDEWPEHLR